MLKRAGLKRPEPEEPLDEDEECSDEGEEEQEEEERAGGAGQVRILGVVWCNVEDHAATLPTSPPSLSSLALLSSLADAPFLSARAQQGGGTRAQAPATPAAQPRVRSAGQRKEKEAGRSHRVARRGAGRTHTGFGSAGGRTGARERSPAPGVFSPSCFSRVAQRTTHHARFACATAPTQDHRHCAARAGHAASFPSVDRTDVVMLNVDVLEATRLPASTPPRVLVLTACLSFFRHQPRQRSLRHCHPLHHHSTRALLLLVVPPPLPTLPVKRETGGPDRTQPAP